MSPIAWSLLLLVAVQVGHLTEEIKTGFRRSFPLGEMPVVFFVSANVVLYAFCAVTVLLVVRDQSPGIAFAWILAVVMLINGLLHLSVMVYKRAYFPGGVTAAPLIAAAVWLMVVLG